ncbi:preprotein translocase subunit SecE [Asticcacaulis sp. AC402]|uniref:preprotein translocase subunit SecE n=1 Tax=Asticcacaulis sp. AC402 TaxID=1282361 RepID=UPI0003C3E3BF|nr:preprotein translocase subunit SecE [Asticcacaulis sp. AC402]ESQ76262.1 hypothetical protein ABAC402_05145 [Asticcacaulis sp. AC402]
MKKPEVKSKTVQGGKTVTGGKTGGGTAIGKVEPAKAAAADTADKAPKKPFNPIKFLSEVRQEARKITWTTRKETWVTTVFVLIMVVLAGVFFLVVDLALGWGSKMLAQIGT